MPGSQGYRYVYFTCLAATSPVIQCLSCALYWLKMTQTIIFWEHQLQQAVAISEPGDSRCGPCSLSPLPLYPVVSHTSPHWLSPTNLQSELDPLLEPSQTWFMSLITLSLGKGASRQSQGPTTMHPCLGSLHTPSFALSIISFLKLGASACHTICIRSASPVENPAPFSD